MSNLSPTCSTLGNEQPVPRRRFRMGRMQISVFTSLCLQPILRMEGIGLIRNAHSCWKTSIPHVHLQVRPQREEGLGVGWGGVGGQGCWAAPELTWSQGVRAGMLALARKGLCLPRDNSRPPGSVSSGSH